MVGLVVVSHSGNVARALIELIQKTTPQAIPLIGVGGVGEAFQEIGTDGIAICDAIQTVFSPEGVLVLMDLGSAILNTEMAKDLLPDEMRDHVRICAAPLVEGAIAAAVQISLGSDLDAVAREARNALAPKAEQLGEAPTPSAEPERLDNDPWLGAETLILTVFAEHGLHARPAARFVKVVSLFAADVRVKNLATGKGPVSAKSLNSIAMLGVRKGHQIEITANGAEARKVLDALQQLAAENFGDALTEAPERATPRPASTTPRAGGDFHGEPISEGIALGCVQYYHVPEPLIPAYESTDAAAEWTRFEEARNATCQGIATEYEKIKAVAGGQAAEIFEAHLAMLRDPLLLEQIKERIEARRMNAAQAWKVSITEIEQAYRDLDDPYLQQRAADVRDVGRRLLRHLSGQAAVAPLEFSQPTVLLAREFTPTQTVQLNLHNVLGLITQIGGTTSHSAILARAMGIPAVVCANEALFELAEGTFIGLNGFTGSIWVAPAQAIVADLAQQHTAWLAKREQGYQSRYQPAMTTDGQRIEIAANIGNLAEAVSAEENGAEAIGLLRSEFLYLGRQQAPDEDEQAAIFSQIGKTLPGKTIIIRTLDVGGDKDIPYLHLPPEDNPFLGVRALRLCLQRPELFITQLKAILRASEDTTVRLMFPMVALLEDLVAAQACLAEAHARLVSEGIPHQWPLSTGLMIETPAAVELSPTLAAQVDFFSIGTNDLTQYTFAADRGNPQLSAYAHALHPVILRMIKRVVDASHQQGKWTGVCGELAGEPLAIPLLLGIGVDELSMTPRAMPQAKALIRELNFKDVQTWAHEALAMQTSQEIQQFSARLFAAHLPTEMASLQSY